MKLAIGIFFWMIGQAYAVECYVTLIKAPCYQDYDVHFTLSDSVTKKAILELDLPKSQFWTRKSFQCTPGQVVGISSSISPVIWEEDAGKIYEGTHFTKFPDIEPPTGTIWAIDVCFPVQFSKVPIPPKITGSCGCDKSSIPPLKNSHVVNQ